MTLQYSAYKYNVAENQDMQKQKHSQIRWDDSVHKANNGTKRKGSWRENLCLSFQDAWNSVIWEILEMGFLVHLVFSCPVNNYH